MEVADRLRLTAREGLGIRELMELVMRSRVPSQRGPATGTGIRAMVTSTQVKFGPEEGAMSQGYSVKVTQSSDGLHIHISGTKAKHIDARLLEGCLNALMSCADANACLESGLRFTEKCVQAIGKHNDSASCVAHGFGFAAKR